MSYTDTFHMMNTQRSRTLRLVFLALNYVGLLAAFAGWFYAAFVAPMGGPSRVAELDRNDVFNEAALRSYSPHLAENLRYNVGHWIEEPTRSSAIFLSFCFGGLAALNILGYHLQATRAASTDEIT